MVQQASVDSENNIPSPEINVATATTTVVASTSTTTMKKSIAAVVAASVGPGTPTVATIGDSGVSTSSSTTGLLAPQQAVARS